MQKNQWCKNDCNARTFVMQKKLHWTKAT
jgi:hypothetical protein